MFFHAYRFSTHNDGSQKGGRLGLLLPKATIDSLRIVHRFERTNAQLACSSVGQHQNHYTYITMT